MGLVNIINHCLPWESPTLTAPDKNSEGIGICCYQFYRNANSDGTHCSCVHLLSTVSKKIHYFNGHISTDISNYISFSSNFFVLGRGRFTTKGREIWKQEGKVIQQGKGQGSEPLILVGAGREKKI